MIFENKIDVNFEYHDISCTTFVFTFPWRILVVLLKRKKCIVKGNNNLFKQIILHVSAYRAIHRFDGHKTIFRVVIFVILRSTFWTFSEKWFWLFFFIAILSGAVNFWFDLPEVRVLPPSCATSLPSSTPTLKYIKWWK